MNIDFKCCSACVERSIPLHNFPYKFLELPAVLRFSDPREVLSHEQRSYQAVLGKEMRLCSAVRPSLLNGAICFGKSI